MTLLANPRSKRSVGSIPRARETRETDEKIPVAVKIPMAPRLITAMAAPGRPLVDVLRELSQRQPIDPAEARLLAQLGREMSAMHDVLAVTEKGELTRVDSGKTTVGDIAAPREIRTSAGIEVARIASLEVQAYAPVGAFP